MSNWTSYFRHHLDTNRFTRPVSVQRSMQIIFILNININSSPLREKKKSLFWYLVRSVYPSYHA